MYLTISVITDKDGNKKLIPILESAIQQPQTAHIEHCQNTEGCETEQPNQSTLRSSGTVCTTSTVPRRTGSLSIIFRKVSQYYI